MVLVVLLFLCAISCIICFTTLYDKTLDNSAADIATQTVESTYSNTSSLLDTINTCSKSILSDSAVQSALTGSSDQNLAVVSQQMRTLLTNRMESISALSSIYLFDLNGHVFHSSRAVSRWDLSAIQRRLRHGIRSAKAAAGISCFSTAGVF